MKRQLALSVVIMLAAWSATAQARASGLAGGICADRERAGVGSVSFRVQKSEDEPLAELAGLETDNVALRHVDAKSLRRGDFESAVDGVKQARRMPPAAIGCPPAPSGASSAKRRSTSASQPKAMAWSTSQASSASTPRSVGKDAGAG